MGNFIKDAFAELEHVVWPTHLETKNFLKTVLLILAGMTIFTYLLTLLFSNSIFATRAWMHAPKEADLSASPVVSGEPIKINAGAIEATTADGQKIEVTPEVK